jgi:hypothetical protein
MTIQRKVISLWSIDENKPSAIGAGRFAVGPKLLRVPIATAPMRMFHLPAPWMLLR